MLTVLASTLALALAFGPQLQINLQAVLDETPAVEAEAGVEESPVIVDTGPAAEVLPLDEVEETIIEESEIAEPAAEIIAEVLAPTPEPDVASGEVPAVEWPAILEAASAALAAAETASGKFMQSNADGTISTGTFALNRPGRMRFDYDDPVPILIVSDGTTVAMEDSELETVDRIPIGTTPLGLILSTDLNVDEDVEVLDVMQNEQGIGIRVSDASGELEGTLTMVFDKDSYDLLG